MNSPFSESWLRTQIEDRSDGLITALARYECEELAELDAQMPAIEAEIKAHALHAVVHALAPGAARPLLTPAGHTFQREGRLYHLMAAPSAKRPELQICVQPMTQATVSFKDGDCASIDAPGYFRSVQISVPQELAGLVVDLTELVRAIFATGYTWLEGLFFRLVGQLAKDFSDALYRHLRTALAPSGHTELAQQVWFSVFGPQKGVYALNLHAVEAIVEQLKARKFSAPQSPLTLMMKVLRLQMPTQDSLSAQAIRAKQYREFELEKASYVSDMPAVYVTEEQMTQGDAYAIFPIGAIDDHQLVAAFPAGLQAQLRPVLERNKDQLLKLYRQQFKPMHKHFKRVSRSIALGDMNGTAAMAGSFVGAAIKSWAK
jgi:hypothetical protein